MGMRNSGSRTTNAPAPRVSRRFRGRALFTAAIATALVGVVMPTRAQPAPGAVTAEPGETARAAASRMVEEAGERFEAGDYAAALELFHRASEANPGPVPILGEARTLVKLGRLVAAEERYVAVGRSPLPATDAEAARTAVQEARAELEKLRQRIPTLTITVAGPEAKDPTVEVQIDGRPVNPALLGYPNPVDPGERVITLWVRGSKVVHVAVALQEGDRTPIVLRAAQSTASAAPAPAGERSPASAGSAVPPPPAAEAAPRSGMDRRPIGWVTLGLGAAGLVTGVVAGLVAENRYDELSEHCPEDRCPPDYHDELDGFRRLRTVSTVGYVVGGVGLAAGVTLVLTARQPEEARRAALALSVGPTGAVLRGRF